MSAMSYVMRKGYFKEYAAAEREAGKAVYDTKVSEDLWMAAKEPLPGTVSPELQASREAERKVNDKNLACAEVAGKIFVFFIGHIFDIVE